MMKRALLLSSGGAKAAFQVGAVEHLVQERGLDFDVFSGASSGSLNATFLAQGKDHHGLCEQLRRLRELWLGIDGPSDIYEERPLSSVLFFATEASFFSIDPLREAIHTHLDPERLRTSGKRLRIGAVVLETGKFKVITEREPKIHEWVLASASFPLAFPPVEVDGVRAVDGGVRQFQPLEIALDALNELGGDEEREVYCVLADPLEVPKKWEGYGDGPSIAERLATIPPIEAFRADFARALRHNRAVRAYLETKRALEELDGAEAALRALEATPFRPPAFRDTRLYVIAPERPLMGTLEFDPGKIRAAYEEGRRAARAPLGEEELDALIPEES